MPKLSTPRIGPKMLLATWYTAQHPGTAKLGAAWYASPYPGNPFSHCGSQYGYEAVNRAMHAGLIAGELRGSKYSLTVTQRGLEVLAATWKEN